MQEVVPVDRLAEDAARFEAVRARLHAKIRQAAADPSHRMSEADWHARLERVLRNRTVFKKFEAARKVRPRDVEWLHGDGRTGRGGRANQEAAKPRQYKDSDDAEELE